MRRDLLTKGLDATAVYTVRFLTTLRFVRNEGLWTGLLTGVQSRQFIRNGSNLRCCALRPPFLIPSLPRNLCALFSTKGLDASAVYTVRFLITLCFVRNEERVQVFLTGAQSRRFIRNRSNLRCCALRPPFLIPSLPRNLCALLATKGLDSSAVYAVRFLTALRFVRNEGLWVGLLQVPKADDSFAIEVIYAAAPSPSFPHSELAEESVRPVVNEGFGSSDSSLCWLHFISPTPLGMRGGGRCLASESAWFSPTSKVVRAAAPLASFSSLRLALRAGYPELCEGSVRPVVNKGLGCYRCLYRQISHYAALRSK